MAIIVSKNVSLFGFNFPIGTDWLSTFGETGTRVAPDTTGTVTINGTLLLEGNLTCYGDITITAAGKVIPVPDKDLKKSYFSLDTFSYTTANGGSRTITSTIGDIYVYGLIDGKGAGFESNQGPGCNSLLTDTSGNQLPGYGASHAGLGYINSSPPKPLPNPGYGHYETPLSLGSGSGYYHNPLDLFGEETKGGGAIKLVARSGIVQIDGKVNMDGIDGTHAGGASGGSIWVHAWEIHGDGTMTAAGGSTLLTSNAGGGAGGYISLWHERSLFYNGLLSVSGKDGAEDGKIFIKKTEPILEDSFTGNIFNTKWWDSTNSVTINNNLLFSLPDDVYDTPEVNSNFYLSGKEITAQVDYAPYTADSSHYNAGFLLYADEMNWVGLARRSTGIYGVSSVNGIVSVSGINTDNTNMTFRLYKNDGTFTYQYFDSTSKPLTIYTDIRPELANKTYQIKLFLEKLSPEDASFKIDHFRLTNLDISHQYLELDGTPADQTAVAVNVIHGPSQYYGLDFYLDGQKIRWDTTDSSSFGDILESNDIIRTISSYNIPPNDNIEIVFDNFKIYDGIITNAETTEPVLYVDPDYGSDTSSGRQLDPLRNLFVATAWAKKGSTIILYDGTHNPTKVSRKNLTIKGAEGVKPLVTSQFSQDTTGSDWEINAISFYGCQGLIENLTINNSEYGIKIENGAIDISRCKIQDTSTAIQFINCDPVITRNEIINTIRAFDFTSAQAPDIYSNIVCDASVAVVLNYTQDATISSNTFDNNQTQIVLDNSSSAIVSNDSLTYAVYGIQASTDSWIGSFNNNFYPIDTSNIYNRVPDASSAYIYANPLYYDRLGTRDFHLNTGSPNIDTGTLDYDEYLYDFDGVRRDQSDIGALQYIPDSTYTGDLYVSSHGDDHWNPGSIDEPFKTLDRAMFIQDSTVHIDGGHYDSFYLSLKTQNIDLNQLYIYFGPEQFFLSYLTLDQEDINNGYIALPSFVEPDDASNVGLNILGGSSQNYGTDYIVEYGSLLWKGYDLENYLAAGDILRVMFMGALQRKALNTFILHGHYSNYDQEKVIFVSPSGSDSTILGGDGTNTGGNGSRSLPYRTIDMALSQSNIGDNIVVMAGEYPVFNGLEGRIIVPGIDRTAIPDGAFSRVYEDFFAPKDFRAYNWVSSDHIPWNFNYTGDSSVYSGGGFLNLTYDGTNTVSAESEFNITGDFEVFSSLRNAVDPVKFMVISPDNTAYLSYDGTDYYGGITIEGVNYECTGAVTSDMTENQLITEYICIGGDNIRNKYASLSYIPESDCTNITLNIVGGVSQNLGEDFYLQDSKIKWDGMNLEEDIEVGDVLRVIYQDRNLSNTLRTMISLIGNRLTVKVYNDGWNIINRRDIDYTGDWKISFIMNEASNESHACIYGKGFVSKFSAKANSFSNSILDEPCTISTEKKSLVFYEDRT